MSNRSVLQRLPFMLLACLLFACVPFAQEAAAASTGKSDMNAALPGIEQAIQEASADLKQSKADYDRFHTTWLKQETFVKEDSQDAYRDIEAAMGQVEYAYMVGDHAQYTAALQDLAATLQRYVQGRYPAASRTAAPSGNTSLPAFIQLLQTAKQEAAQHDRAAAMKQISAVQNAWLSVEGRVVSKSNKIYNDTERDMVTAKAYISQGDWQSAVGLLSDMIAYLTPLAGQSGYSLWDAAMIPIREGLEALLVVAALLSFVKKTEERKGSRWIWSGVILGILVSAGLAVIVKYIFSSGAFGNNNFLISGYTGIFAGIMLLYMSYWLHSKSNIAQWNRYISTKTRDALSTGRIVSLGILSFLAVFREGTETVLFIIGMANEISLRSLLLGLLLGVGVLVAIALLMLVVGVRLPIRPFFLVSSMIIFYLCLKFTGLGLHSLQLAGVLPVSSAPMLPSLDFIGFYPSWQSAVPQFIIALSAVVFLAGQWLKTRNRAATHTP